MFFRAAETNNLSVFHVENGKIQSVLWFSVCFHVEIREICVKNRILPRFIYDLYEIIRFFGGKRLILSKLLTL